MKSLQDGKSHVKSKLYIHLTFSLQSFVCFWSKEKPFVKLSGVRWKGKGRGEACREEGSERVSLQASWADGTASSSSENAVGGESLERWGQGQAPVPERSGR